MKPINKKKLPLKYALNFTSLNPTPIDLLYEIVTFLSNEHRDEFTEGEIKSKTKSRFGTLDENIQYLISNGFITKGKYSKYILIQHPWE